MARRAWAWSVGGAALVLVAGGAFALGAASEELPPVTVQPESAAARNMPQTRAEAITAWTAELKEAGKVKPAGWEKLTTDEIKDRYLSQHYINAPDAADIDPGMVKRD
ncbi:hypothetical protein ACHGLA_21040 [Streptomyces sp. YH02]|uniref:hypothetical protein n=1 Tax=Streptomyces sp. YH02 TaxID=3256999 RepID=UPI003756A186